MAAVVCLKFDDLIFIFIQCVVLPVSYSTVCAIIEDIDYHFYPRSTTDCTRRTRHAGRNNTQIFHENLYYIRYFNK